MSRFVKLATTSELPRGSAAEVEFEGRVYAIYNIDGVVQQSMGSARTREGRSPRGCSRGRWSPAVAWLAI